MNFQEFDILQERNMDLDVEVSKLERKKHQLMTILEKLVPKNELDDKLRNAPLVKTTLTQVTNNVSYRINNSATPGQSLIVLKVTDTNTLEPYQEMFAIPCGTFSPYKQKNCSSPQVILMSEAIDVGREVCVKSEELDSDTATESTDSAYETIEACRNIPEPEQRELIIETDEDIQEDGSPSMMNSREYKPIIYIEHGSY